MNSSLIKKALFQCRSIYSTSKLKKLIHIKDDNDFHLKVLHSENPVIVNFHAEWCEPCHILTPKLTELLENMENVDLATVDVENYTELADTFEVKAVPAVVAIKNGLIVDKFIGLVDANMIENMINRLNKKK
ncbi:thioredoxin, mitochondrial [Onthophagus taurus]|uniref:thioredoxin, mitochondrial n=1 Tax=Onthophagus taurus TaxID=166361 RepID=UPI000C1FDEC9|nr:thioredoxin, mitochondrial [Onthophagus taurus]